MTETNELQKCRTLAKRYARTKRIKLAQALDLVAGELGFLNWAKLISASKRDWLATPEHVATVDAFVARSFPAFSLQDGDPKTMARRLKYLDQADEGTIKGHAYRIQEILGDVMIAGDGWSIRVFENPGAIPVVETYTSPGSDCPVGDDGFLQTALKLAQDRADQVRGAIATDWDRRCTKPDIAGVVRHPLSSEESSVWFCLHCHSKITGIQIAQNLWHCPGCGASPLDIFETAFWSHDQGKSFPNVSTKGTIAEGDRRLRIIDGRPNLDLDAAKVALLIRSALLEDATNVSERFAAMLADISVDDDGDVWIALEVALWPEDKDAVQTMALGQVLGVDIEFLSSWSTIPFAWPGLGEETSSTCEYTRMMLDAYAQYGGLPNKKRKES